MAKLMRTAFLIGLAVTWRPDAAAGQYSWSTFSVSAGLGTGGFGVGASYAAVDPWYDSYYVSTPVEKVTNVAGENVTPGGGDEPLVRRLLLCSCSLSLGG